MEGGLRLFACHQLQTVQRVEVLDGTPLEKRREPSKISDITGKRTSTNKNNTRSVSLNRFRIRGLLQ